MKYKYPNYEELSFDEINTLSIDERYSKVSVDDFAETPKSWESINIRKELFPNILKSEEFFQFCDYIKNVRREGRQILWLTGAHIVKVGLSKIVIELAKKGFITAFAANGALAIHDVEISLFGKTSEDVEKSIKDGKFGVTKETAEFINDAISTGAKQGYGYGESIARALIKANPKYKDYSIIYNLFVMGVPITIHTIPGAEVIHIHPDVDDKAVGETSMRDFRRFCSFVSKLEGGAVLGWGSAVVMPEIFLKALSIARNLGYKVENFRTAYFDMYIHYRPMQNIVLRPTTGKGSYFVGHHEIMMPLLASILLGG